MWVFSQQRRWLKSPNIYIYFKHSNGVPVNVFCAPSTSLTPESFTKNVPGPNRLSADFAPVHLTCDDPLMQAKDCLLSDTHLHFPFAV